MHPYFNKLNLVMPDEVDEDQLKGEYVIDYSKCLTYYSIKNEDYFRKTFPEFYSVPPDNIYFVELTYSIGPHIDHGPIASVNFYFKPNNGTTSFYEKVNPDDAGKKHPGRKSANIFKDIPLNKIVEFKADKNEAYLLNQSKIHSVSAPIFNKRKFITWQWNNESYENILKTIEEKNVTI